MLHLKNAFWEEEGYFSGRGKPPSPLKPFKLGPLKTVQVPHSIREATSKLWDPVDLLRAFIMGPAQDPDLKTMGPCGPAQDPDLQIMGSGGPAQDLDLKIMGDPHGPGPVIMAPGGTCSGFGLVSNGTRWTC